MPAYQAPPPPPPSPAIVQQVQFHLVQMPISILTEDKRAVAAATLAICGNFTTPHNGRSNKDLTSHDPEDALHCRAIIQDAVRNGTISDMPAMTLALRSIEFTDSKGGDKVVRTMDDIALKIAATPPGTQAVDYVLPGLDPSQIIRTAFTIDAIKAVTIRDGHEKILPEMTPLHAIPIDPSTAYIITAADIVAHPARYTNDGMTLAQTLADARTRHSVADDAKITKSCFDNDGTYGLHECVQVAARDTGEMITKGDFKPYDPELYSAARIAATDPINYCSDCSGSPTITPDKPVKFSQRYEDIYTCQRVLVVIAAFNGVSENNGVIDKNSDLAKAADGLVGALVAEGGSLGMTAHDVIQDWKDRNTRTSITPAAIHSKEFDQKFNGCTAGNFEELGLQYYKQ